MGLASVAADEVLAHRRLHLAALDSSPFSAEAAAKIRRYGAPLGLLLEHHAQLDRCMSRLQQLMTEAEAKGGSLPAGAVVLADSLSQSLGRFERHWHAPPGGIWLTAAWPDVLVPEFSRLLPFAAGLACCRTVRLHGLDARLKWVNDVLVNGRKIAGVLCSTIFRPNKDRWHCIGIGLNANNQDFPTELQASAASMAGELGHALDLRELAGQLLAELSWAVGLLHYDEALALREGQSCEDGRESLLLSAWRQLSNTIGRRVEYGFDVQKEPLFQAKAVALDPCGGLVMELEDGGRVTEYSGEIVYL
ncbi:MAG: biotin--[acetyl-CoA-carboxylase] ligase [Candidatus Electronema sp. V4]|uniref:biotin--[acetyl-CoA-carboxylase] ligase n=1 Tax=Candidatus Electronema sp. V4 TaxID=3454756 RepID=UPI0040555FE0